MTFVKVILKGDLRMVKNLIIGSLPSPSKTVLALLALKIDTFRYIEPLKTPVDTAKHTAIYHKYKNFIIKNTDRTILSASKASHLYYIMRSL